MTLSDYLPQPLLILAGLFTQMTVENIIQFYTTDYHIRDQLTCKYHLIWLQFVVLSVAMAFLSAIKAPPQYRLVRSVLTMFGSLIVNMAAPMETLSATLHCHHVYFYTVYPAAVILILSGIIVLVVFLSKPPSTSLLPHLPDSDVILAGVCLQYGYEWVSQILINWPGNASCYGNWIQMISLSLVLVVVQVVKAPSQYTVSRGLLAFFCSFIIHFISGENAYIYLLFNETCVGLDYSASHPVVQAMLTAGTGLMALVTWVVFLLTKDNVTREVNV